MKGPLYFYAPEEYCIKLYEKMCAGGDNIKSPEVFNMKKNHKTLSDIIDTVITVVVDDNKITRKRTDELVAEVMGRVNNLSPQDSSKFAVLLQKAPNIECKHEKDANTLRYWYYKRIEGVLDKLDEFHNSGKTWEEWIK